MTDQQFITLMALTMVSDPWPLQTGQDVIDGLLDDESRNRGFSDWIEAYHALPSVG